MRRVRGNIAGLIGLGVLLVGCSTTQRVARMDRRAQRFIAAAQKQVTPNGPTETIDVDHYQPPPPDLIEKPLKLDLRTCLELAARHSREYQTSRENLFRAAISLVVAAHTFEWNIGNRVEAELAHDLDASETAASGDGSLSFTRTFVSGARMSLNLAIQSLRYLSGDKSIDITSLASATVTQPLLSGRGRLVAREPLTQAERNLVYALRSYVRTRKNLVLQVARSYYNVLSAQDAVDVAQRNYENLRAERERSELMARAGRLPEFQVDQARQNELTAEAQLIARRQALESREDALKQVLALPLSVRLQVDRADLERLSKAKLPPPPVSFEEAVKEALANRLDLATVRDELDDAERAVRIARDALRMKLDLVLRANASSPTHSNLTAIEFDKADLSAGLQGELPLDKVAETATYRRALITRNQRKRGLDQKRDDIVAAIRADWRNLNSGRENIRIQQNSVALARQRVESTQLLFQAGRVHMRDVLEARDALVRARNSLTQALVAYRLDWLQLLVDMERLPVDPSTLWAEPLQVAGSPPGTENQTR